MATKRVLSLGQCGADHWAISTLLERQFGAEVVSADTFADAEDKLGRNAFDLVLVNRVLDRNGASGLDFIAELKAKESIAHIPVMLVSNHRDAQRQAIALGARPGFGKAALGDAATVAMLRGVLGDDAA